MTTLHLTNQSAESRSAKGCKSKQPPANEPTPIEEKESKELLLPQLLLLHYHNQNQKQHESEAQEEQKLFLKELPQQIAANSTRLDKLFDPASGGGLAELQLVGSKKFQEEENYSPFPKETHPGRLGLELALNEQPRPLTSQSIQCHVLKKKTPSFRKTKPNPTSMQNSSSSYAVNSLIFPQSLLNDEEMNFLRNKITQMIQGNQVDGMAAAAAAAVAVTGVGLEEREVHDELYDDDDEEEEEDEKEGDGHDNGSSSNELSCCYNKEKEEILEIDFSQDDYDVSEVDGPEEYAYKLPPSAPVHKDILLDTSSALQRLSSHANDGYRDKFPKHTDSELNSKLKLKLKQKQKLKLKLQLKPDQTFKNFASNSRYEKKLVFHEDDNNENNVFQDDVDDDDDDDDDEYDGPSCEFTFEYDSNGQLIPIANNIEEKLRQMEISAKRARRSALNGQERNLARNQINYKSNRNIIKTDSRQRRDRPKNANNMLTLKSNDKVEDRTPFNALADLQSLRTLSMENNLNLQKYRLRNEPFTIPRNFFGLIPSDTCCLLCQYEAVYGSKPVQLLKMASAGGKRK
ncbi:hypothetical protein LELG_00879 [Lodderomyces elongisporus NRRL YB-4239]|uniref:Protein IBD2 n=1 Tax=Lodderomyces elongisporus (strain ATCC 11503 / CBS 2605 / JCM 1781 / NBRC 1676 / NRRL YB-4239) TaxID=379508 RepID=A5DU43_LODEL|nr:hypothetical protein LELG_00879 [Lodderomyces elongisporus NRRL YB-4239]